MRVSDGSGNAVQVQMEQPEEGGLHLQVVQPPAAVEQAARQAGSVGRGAGCSLGYVVIALFIIAAIRLFTYRGMHPATDPLLLAQQFLPCSRPQPPLASMNLLPPMPLLTEMQGLDVDITSVSLTNQIGVIDRLTSGLSSCGEYLIVDGSLTNTGPGTVDFPAQWIQFHSPDNKTFGYAVGWDGTVDVHISIQLHYVFEVPPGTAGDGFQLLLEPSGQEPSTVALDTRVASASCSRILSTRGKAEAQGLTYQVISAALASEYGGDRAANGECYLVVGLRVANPLGVPVANPISPDDVTSVISEAQQMLSAVTETQQLTEAMSGSPATRLLIGETSLAPFKSKALSVTTSGPFDLQEAFVIPAETTEADLQVGDADQPGTATIPMHLRK